ncbi:hypothetical protein A5320_10130 [Rheinheimera sp. SA_1]|jgi:hypothetical protein|uniref:DNA-binding protein n=1 Tax=Rheinheimera sp. SA_1 TaxID=1827365 RepID=UPI00080089A7|nr:DNA-binding protein [Rheinheimera sp. SA_1]OBP15663.1 hypothetical protein A5320_10130 [Rheinheimera sp. SA_1]
MTDLYPLVCQTAAKLQAEGKTPSLALVRAHAGKGLDAAALFSAYQQWRSNPPAVLTETQQATTTSTEQECTAAESSKDCEIKALREEVAQLHVKVDRLTLFIEQLAEQIVAQQILPAGIANVRR